MIYQRNVEVENYVQQRNDSLKQSRNKHRLIIWGFSSNWCEFFLNKNGQQYTTLRYNCEN